MIATVHVADLGAAGTVRTLLRRPAVDQVPGLRWADVAPLAQLATSRAPSLRRAVLMAFWDDDAAVDRFVGSHPVGRRFADGFHARLSPLRAFGSWPGLPSDLPTARTVPHEGPVVVFTLGRLRLSQTVRFLRTSRPAERAALESPGFVWGTAAARPPFVATISIWEHSRASATYAFGRQRPQHSEAIAAQERKDFHRQSAFVRFVPLHVSGSLDGPNPLAPAAINV